MRLGRARRGSAGRAGDHRCDEEHQLVDEAGGEERGRDRRAALEQERLHALGRERAQLVLERAAAQLELQPGGPWPNASRRGCFVAPTSRASSRGSSARTVPIPTATASTDARSSCTSRRDSSPDTQRRPGTTTRPSSVTATLYVTNGRPSATHVRHASFWRRASELSSSSTSTPASRSRSTPPAASGSGRARRRRRARPPPR